VNQSSQKTRDGNVSGSEAVSINSVCQSQHHVHHHGAQFYVAKFDFACVDTPLLVVLWILFTAAAKIGQKTCSSTIYTPRLRLWLFFN